MSSGSHGQRNLPFRGARQLYRGTAGEDNVSRASRANTTDDDDENDVLALDDEELERRAYEVSDYLSSFVETTLPWEWAQQEEIAATITLVEATLDRSNWTEKWDHQRSLIKWACYEQDSSALKLFSKIKAPRERTIVFRQKLRRRFLLHFDNYGDGRVDAEDTATLLRDLTENAEADRIRRDEDDHDREMWKMFLIVLQKATEAVDSPQEANSAPSESGGIASEETLFYELFVEDHGTDFVLTTLEGIEFSTLDAATKAESCERIEEVLQQLALHRARLTYRAHLGRIFTRLSTT